MGNSYHGIDNGKRDIDQKDAGRLEARFTFSFPDTSIDQ